MYEFVWLCVCVFCGCVYMCRAFFHPIPLIISQWQHSWYSIAFCESYYWEMNGNGARSKPTMILYDVFHSNARLITTPHNGQKNTIKLDAKWLKNWSRAKMKQVSTFWSGSEPLTNKTIAPHGSSPLLLHFFDLDTHRTNQTKPNQNGTKRTALNTISSTLLCGCPHLKEISSHKIQFSIIFPAFFFSLVLSFFAVSSVITIIIFLFSLAHSLCLCVCWWWSCFWSAC